MPNSLELPAPPEDNLPTPGRTIQPIAVPIHGNPHKIPNPVFARKPRHMGHVVLYRKSLT
jgi:hypothetical protein